MDRPIVTKFGVFRDQAAMLITQVMLGVPRVSIKSIQPVGTQATGANPVCHPQLW